MTERIKKAIDIFLDAINDGTLAKGTCVACAVGNLVAHGKGGKIRKNDDFGIPNFICTESNTNWSMAFSSARTETGAVRQSIYKEMLHHGGVLEDVYATDFTLDELMKIEFTFEANTKKYYSEYQILSPEEIRRDQIKGLAAVVKVMLSFDSEKEVQDSEVYECFISKAELIPITQ